MRNSHYPELCRTSHGFSEALWRKPRIRLRLAWSSGRLALSLVAEGAGRPTHLCARWAHVDQRTDTHLNLASYRSEKKTPECGASIFQPTY